MEIDQYIDPLYNKGDQDSLLYYSGVWATAKTAAEKQAAHDAANQIRLKYADSVTRVDFINGGSTAVSKTSNTITKVNKDGTIVQTYIKGEVAVSFIATAGA